MEKNYQTTSLAKSTNKNTYLEIATTDEEKEFVTSLFGNLPIKTFAHTDECRAKLTDVFVHWMNVIGKQAQDKEAFDFVIVLVMESYPQFTIDELNQCLKLAITKKLDCDVIPYNGFNGAYVANILNAYENYRAQMMRELALKKSAHEEKKLKESVRTDTRTDEQKLDDLKTWLRECKTDIENNELIIDYSFAVWNFLYTRRRLLTVSEEMKTEAAEYADRRLDMEVADGRINVDMTDENLLKRFKREFCLRRFFDDFDLEHFISTLTLIDVQ